MPVKSPVKGRTKSGFEVCGTLPAETRVTAVEVPSAWWLSVQVRVAGS